MRASLFQFTRPGGVTRGAVRAWQSLGDNERAFALVRRLLERDPRNSECRFRYALLLGAHPRELRAARVPSVEPNAATLLNELAREHPDRPEYGVALAELTCRKMRYTRHFQARDWQELGMALALSDKLLGRFPNTPGVVPAVVALRQAHVAALRRDGQMSAARKETERLQGMLEIIFHNPETPDAAREALLAMQLEQLGRLAARKETAACVALAAGRPRPRRVGGIPRHPGAGIPRDAGVPGPRGQRRAEA